MTKSKTSLLVIIVLILTHCSTPEIEGILLVNHVGYNIDDDKKLVFQTESEYRPEAFQVVNTEGEIVYSGIFKEGGAIDQWHTGNAYSGSFTEFQNPGVYHAQVDLGKEMVLSHSFNIGKNQIAIQSLPLLIRGFDGVQSDGIYEETDSSISFYGDRDDIVDLRGGWYDASGEKGKYLSHLAFTNFLAPQQTPVFVWNMLTSAKMYKQSEGVGTIIDELHRQAVFGADFLIRMQDPDGYFYQTIFANWSWDPELREICAYQGQDGQKTDKYQSAFREGAGITIAALAKAASENLSGEFSAEQYLEAAISGFDHLVEHNLEYIDDGKENIIDDYCALMAATELFNATEAESYLEYARNRMEKLSARLSSDDQHNGWWRADDSGERSYFHGAEAGYPIVSLCRYLDVEEDEAFRAKAIETIQTSVDFELGITNEVNNPFGYARQYVKAVDESSKHSAFFIPHQNESGYWWQGENARLASLSSAIYLSLPYLSDTQINGARQYAADQINWILGLNPYDACMLQGTGQNNPDYKEGEESLNLDGGVCNGITAGFDNEKDIAFMPLPYNDDLSHRWRWSEQWTLHGAWLMMAAAASMR